MKKQNCFKWRNADIAGCAETLAVKRLTDDRLQTSADAVLSAIQDYTDDHNLGLTDTKVLPAIVIQAERTYHNWQIATR